MLSYECPVCHVWGKNITITHFRGRLFVDCHLCRIMFELTLDDCYLRLPRGMADEVWDAIREQFETYRQFVSH